MSLKKAIVITMCSAGMALAGGTAMAMQHSSSLKHQVKHTQKIKLSDFEVTSEMKNVSRSICQSNILSGSVVFDKNAKKVMIGKAVLYDYKSMVMSKSHNMVLNKWSAKYMTHDPETQKVLKGKVYGYGLYVKGMDKGFGAFSDKYCAGTYESELMK